MSKASAGRFCPALKREISSAECGGQRQSRIACAADCPHNPFAPANYAQLLQTENGLDDRTLDRLSALAADRAAWREELAAARARGQHEAHALIVQRLFFEQDANRATFAQRWEQSGWPELKNDERVLLRAKMQMRVTLLEIHRVLPEGQVEGVDLLAPEAGPMILVDRNLASMAVRFATLFTWTFPLPHFWRLSGTAAIMPDVAFLSAAEVLLEIIQHLGGPPPGAEQRRWLALNFIRVSAALTAVGLARRQQVFAGMDAKWGQAVYELQRTPATCRKHLDAHADVSPDDLSDNEHQEGFTAARAWADSQNVRSPEAAVFEGQIMLGRVLLGPKRWRLEAMGAERLARLRRQFEAQMGQRVRFASELINDVGAQMAAKGPAADDALVPPRLLENPTQMALFSSRIPASPANVSRREMEEKMAQNAGRAFLDGTVPGLDHQTPRAAAQNPQLRPKLAQLMKERIRDQDQRNLKTGDATDLNWMLQELGLTELIFPAPPHRPPPSPEVFIRSNDLEEEESERPPAPPLPAKPLEMEDAIDRLESAMNFFKSAAVAEAELDASGSTLLDDCLDITDGYLTEDDFIHTIASLLQAWFALVPPGHLAPELDYLGLASKFKSNLAQFQTMLQKGSLDKLVSSLSDSAQPALMTAVVGGFVEVCLHAPANCSPRPEALPASLALLKTVIEQLDETLRPR